MNRIIRIGTRDSQLAVWQATQVQKLFEQTGLEAKLEYIKSDGDVDLITPLYEIGVQGVFTRNLDAALLSGQIDIAVHSLKDVPVQLAKGVAKAAVLKRWDPRDLIVYKDNKLFLDNPDSSAVIATSSIRRKAQWLQRYPKHTIENLRGNINTRLRKLEESSWQGAIFATAGLERLDLRPDNAIVLDWMLPAPAQGAIVAVCNENDDALRETCSIFNDTETDLCTQIERDFLKALMGGCSTPVGAWARVEDDRLLFTGNLFSLDGKKGVTVEKQKHLKNNNDLLQIGTEAAKEVLQNGGKEILEEMRREG